MPLSSSIVQNIALPEKHFFVSQGSLTKAARIFGRTVYW
jgi:hypothetical protein